MTEPSSPRDAYVAANRAAWDESAPWHRGGERWRELTRGLARPGFSCLDTTLSALLQEVGVAGKAVVQLGCNNARELLSVKTMGAKRCVGVDQSAAFLAQGRELAEIAGHDVELVESDVYALPHDYDAAFDRVLVTVGVLGWMPDLQEFGAVAARLLGAGGALLVYEQHPLLNVFEPAAATPFEPQYAYFDSTPFAESHAVVYDGQAGDEVTTHYWFVHTLADVVTALLAAGLRLESFREYPHNISSAAFDVYTTRPGVVLPLSYALVARKG